METREFLSLLAVADYSRCGCVDLEYVDVPVWRLLWWEMISNCCKLFSVMIHVILAIQSNSKPWMSCTNYCGVIIQTGPPQHPKLWPTYPASLLRKDTSHLNTRDLFYPDHCIITIMMEMLKKHPWPWRCDIEDSSMWMYICRKPWWTQIEPHITKAKHQQQFTQR